MAHLKTIDGKRCLDEFNSSTIALAKDGKEWQMMAKLVDG
jgi:hypothetical protein